MTPPRFAALVTCLVAAGCYREAPPQSTFADPQVGEPQYVAGPPGGAVDPGFSGAASPDEQFADDNGDDAAGDPRGAAPGAAGIAAAPPALAPPDDLGDRQGQVDEDLDEDLDGAPGAAAPGPSIGAGVDVGIGAGAPPPDDVAQLGPGDAQPGDPTAGVTDPEIDAALDGYGQWIETDDYGQVWRPDATVVGVDFTPYESGGSWAYTDAGWAFTSDYPWGWLPFHYGRWAWFGGYWAWCPGYQWSPAWVQWRHGGGVVGWRPLAPHFRDHRHNRHRWHGGDAPVRDHRRASQHDAHWRFAQVKDFHRPHIRSHLYGNPAEGLRVTSRVKAPPLRASGAVVPARDLMRNRWAAGRVGRSAAGSGPARVRDHRDLRGQPGPAIRPASPPPIGAAPPRTYQPARPSVYYPPAQRPSQVYHPGPPPARTYQPRPSAPPPTRTYQPRPSSPPPAQVYQPRPSSPPPAAQPPRSFQPRPSSPPPAAPPPRSFQPRPSSPPPAAPPPRASNPPPAAPPPSRSSPSSSSHSNSSSSNARDHRR